MYPRGIKYLLLKVPEYLVVPEQRVNADAQCAISLDQVLLDRVECCALCSVPVLSKYSVEYLFIVEVQVLLDDDLLPNEVA